MNLPSNVKERLAKVTNVIHTLAIIQEGYVKELESTLGKYGAFRYEYKNHINTIKHKSEQMRAAIFKCDPQNAEEYGEEADKIEELINKLMEYDS